MRANRYVWIFALGAAALGAETPPSALIDAGAYCDGVEPAEGQGLKYDAGGGCWMGADISAIGDLSGAASVEITPNWDVPPKECASELYRWTGDGFACQQSDRVDGVLAQRNHYYQANVSCLERAKSIQTAQEMDRLQEAARKECRESGKRFSASEFKCTGVLPRGDQK